MTGWISLLASALAGYWFLQALGIAGSAAPGRLGLVLRACLGAGLGLGLSSCIFSVLLWAGWGTPPAVLAANLALAAAALLLRRRGASQQPPAQGPRAGSLLWVLRAAGAATIALLVVSWAVTTEASPHGDWDAFWIWNLRAKFLAGGQASWHHAVSAHWGRVQLGATHPDYPLLLSGLVAQLWMLSGGMDPWHAAAVSLLFALLTAGLLLAALAWLRQEALGWLAVLLLVSSELFASQVAAQYADIPLAFYMLGCAVMLSAAGREPESGAPWLAAGAYAGPAAWTKHEGIVFFLLALGWTAWRRRARPLLHFLLGAAPGIALLGVFKLFIAPLSVGFFPSRLGEALAKLADPARWGMIARSYAQALWDMGPWWAHPIALVLLCLWAAGWAEKQRRKDAWVLLLPAGMLAADFLVYLITTADLGWHLGTSCNRLWLQVWPTLLFGAFLAAGPWPEAQARAAQRSRDRRDQTPGRRSPRR